MTKKKEGVAKGEFIIIGLVSIVIASIVVIKDLEKAKNIVPTNQETPTPTITKLTHSESTTPEITENPYLSNPSLYSSIDYDDGSWQTYNNKKFGFSIKYPHNWYYDDTEDPFNERYVHFANFKPPYVGMAGTIPDGCHFRVQMIDSTRDTQFKNSINQYTNTLKTQTKQKIDGMNFKTHVSEFPDPSYKNRPMINTYLVYENEIALLAYYADPSISATKCANVFVGMTESFKRL